MWPLRFPHFTMLPPFYIPSSVLFQELSFCLEANQTHELQTKKLEDLKLNVKRNCLLTVAATRRRPALLGILQTPLPGLCLSLAAQGPWISSGHLWSITRLFFNWVFKLFWLPILYLVCAVRDSTWPRDEYQVFLERTSGLWHLRWPINHWQEVQLQQQQAALPMHAPQKDNGLALLCNCAGFWTLDTLTTAYRRIRALQPEMIVSALCVAFRT